MAKKSEVSDESDVTAAQPKVKKAMSEAQLENLRLARLKAAEARKAIGDIKKREKLLGTLKHAKNLQRKLY